MGDSSSIVIVGPDVLEVSSNVGGSVIIWLHYSMRAEGNSAGMDHFFSARNNS